MTRKGLSVLKILSQEDSGELIAADAEHGTVLEDGTDQLAGGEQVLVSLVVAVLVVDELEVVAVEHADGNLPQLAFVQPLLEPLEVVVKAALVPNMGERVHKDLFVQAFHHSLALSGPPLGEDEPMLDEHHRRHGQNDHHHRDDDGRIVPDEAGKAALLFLRGIIGQSPVDGGAADQIGGPGEDGVELLVPLLHRDAQVCVLSGGQLREPVALAQVRQVVVLVVADHEAVGLSAAHRLNAGLDVRAGNRLPVREMIPQDSGFIGVVLPDGRRYLLLLGKTVPIRLADHGVDFRSHHRRGQDQALSFSVGGAEVGGEHAVHLSLLQGLKGGRGGWVGDGLELQLSVFQAVGGVVQVVLQGAGERSRPLIRSTEGQKVVLIPHPDGSVAREPVLLLLTEEETRPGEADVLLGELLVEVPVFVLNPAHGSVQLFPQVRALFVEGKVEVGGANLHLGNRFVDVPIHIQGEVGVQLAPLHHLQGSLLGVGQLYQLCLNAVLFGPIIVEPALDAALGHADALAVQRRGGVLLNLGVLRGGEKVVLLGAHGHIRIEHLLLSFRQIGHIAHQVDLAGHQHLHQLGPAALHIFIIPPGVSGDFTLILVGVAGAPPKLVCGVEGRLVPADPHGLRALQGAGAWQKRPGGQERAHQQRCPAFCGGSRLLSNYHAMFLRPRPERGP